MVDLGADTFEVLLPGRVHEFNPGVIVEPVGAHLENRRGEVRQNFLVSWVLYPPKQTCLS